MRRISHTAIASRCGQRSLILRPEGTPQPERYPLGYVPLDGSEPIDVVYQLLKEGNFVAPSSKIEVAHNVRIGIRHLTEAEYPVLCYEDLQNLSLSRQELCSRILLRRDFWVLDDFNDPELNRSFGLQNVYFDNYKWSQVLWKRFQLFAEEYYPVTDHTHITYEEYLQLIRSYSHFEQGVNIAPLLPRKYKLHPPLGIPVPTKLTLQPQKLFQVWLTNFRDPLMLNKALVVKCGSGAHAFVTKAAGVPMVRASDPRPRAVEAARKDATQLGKQFEGMSFQVSEMFPPRALKDVQSNGMLHKYDLITICPDQELLQLFSTESNDFAPASGGFAGVLEQFFEGAGEYLSDTGVLAVCCTNLYSLLEPTKPSPIEYEIRQNRRWLVIDYYDKPLSAANLMLTGRGDGGVRLFKELSQKLRSEVWILHKVDALPHFAFLHDIPGAEPPSTVARHWKNKSLGKMRRRVMKEQVDLMGGDWGEYKTRLLHMLQNNSGDEDDVAEGVRMALDPSYPIQLAERSRVAVEKNLEERREFHEEVMRRFPERSPRDSFDQRYLADRR